MLVVGGQEKVCAVRFALPLPMLRLRARVPHRISPFRMPLTTDLRLSGVASRRCARAPRAQHGCRVRVDGSGRVSGGARLRGGRSRAERRRRLNDGPRWPADRPATADRSFASGQPPSGRCTAPPRWSSGRHARRAACRVAGVALGPSVAASSAPSDARRVLS